MEKEPKPFSEEKAEEIMKTKEYGYEEKSQAEQDAFESGYIKRGKEDMEVTLKSLETLVGDIGCLLCDSYGTPQFRSDFIEKIVFNANNLNISRKDLEDEISSLKKGRKFRLGFQDYENVSPEDSGADRCFSGKIFVEGVRNILSRRNQI